MSAALKILSLIGVVFTVPVSPRYSLARRIATSAALLMAGTLFFYWIPALPDAPAYGDAGHFGTAIGDAALTEAIVLLMIRFVIKPDQDPRGSK